MPEVLVSNQNSLTVPLQEAQHTLLNNVPSIFCVRYDALLISHGQQSRLLIQVEDFTGKGLDDLKAGVIRTPLPPVQTFLDGKFVLAKHQRTPRDSPVIHL